MTVRAFVNTNIVVYAESADGDKTGRAVQIVESLPVVSTQVVNETISVLTRKHRFSLAKAYEVAESLWTCAKWFRLRPPPFARRFELPGATVYRIGIP